jgi:glycosyltransferase involved in cell wall biosynthesis
MISVIIPAFNDGESIGNTVAYVYANAAYKRLLKEVIVVDGGSGDNTVNEAEKAGARVLRTSLKGRAARSNFGARKASGEILYFLPAASLPPSNFIGEIAKAHSKGFACGTFSLKYNSQHWLLNGMAWVTNRYSNWLQLCDQSLFVTKELFDKSGGFRIDHLVMSHQEMIKRMKRYSNFVVLKDSVLSSPKKFLTSGFIKTGALQGVVYVMHKMGYSQRQMVSLYRRFLNWDIGTKTNMQRNKRSPKQKETVTQDVPSSLKASRTTA